METVVDLAAERNPSDITTAAIAKRMGVTEGALFRHFRSKDAILEATMSWVAEQLLARVDAAAQEAPSTVAALEAIFHAHVDFVARHPGVPRMLFGQLQRPEASLAKRAVRALLRRYGERLRQLLETGRDRGELDARLDVDAAVAMFIGMVQGLVIRALLAGKPARVRQAAPGAFALFRRAIGAAP